MPTDRQNRTGQGQGHGQEHWTGTGSNTGRTQEDRTGQGQGQGQGQDSAARDGTGQDRKKDTKILETKQALNTNPFTKVHVDSRRVHAGLFWVFL